MHEFLTVQGVHVPIPWFFKGQLYMKSARFLFIYSRLRYNVVPRMMFTKSS